jgi:hypothetical protein
MGMGGRRNVPANSPSTDLQEAKWAPSPLWMRVEDGKSLIFYLYFV